MQQKQFNEKLLAKAKGKGWFLTFLLSKLLPFLWENRDELADLFRKDKPVVKSFDPPATCGGVPLPRPKLGQVGYWECQNDEWVWVIGV